MSNSEDRKTREVVVAQYAYRHEAEFAAGFLDDARIPYRLQIDDPAMGLTVASPATLWVRAIDLAGAREILDIEVKAARSNEALTGVPPKTGMIPETRLGYRERGLALAASIGAAAGAPFAGGAGPGGTSVALVVAVGLLVVALLGRAPSFVRQLLRALAGSAP